MFSTSAAPAGLLLFSNMSDETDSPPENLPSPADESAPRARRISTPRPKKAAKPSEPLVETPAPESAQVDHSEAPESASSENDWPEPDAATGGNATQSESAKRKRRRRKGKGQSSAPQNGGAPGQDAPVVTISEPNESFEQAAPAPRPPAGPPPMKVPQPQQQPRVKIDPELLTKMAWKIYLAEVSEEGVALIGDADAKDLSRRCFRLAEIFIEEQSRRR